MPRSVTQELLPWIRHHYELTSDPAHTVIGGSSLGGLAAAFAGLQAPDVFGNILSQAGAFWWGPDLADDGEPEWLTRQFVKAPLLPLRFYLDVGLQDRATKMATDQLVTNRHLRDVLEAKGYQVHYAEYNGGHSYLNFRATLASGLLALVGKAHKNASRF